MSKFCAALDKYVHKSNFLLCNVRVPGNPLAHLTCLIGKFARMHSAAVPFAQTPRQNTARRTDTSYLYGAWESRSRRIYSLVAVSFSHTRCSFRPPPPVEGREGAAAGGPGGRRWRRIPPLPAKTTRTQRRRMAGCNQQCGCSSAPDANNII